MKSLMIFRVLLLICALTNLAFAAQSEDAMLTLDPDGTIHITSKDGKPLLTRSPNPPVTDDYKDLPEFKNLRSPIVQVGSSYVDDSKPSAPRSMIAGAGTVSALVSSPTSTSRVPIVMTAAHLVGGADPWILLDGKRVPVEVLAAWPEYDTAYLKLPTTDIPPVFVIDNDRVVTQSGTSWRLQCLAGRAKPVRTSNDWLLPSCPPVRPEERLHEVEFLPPLKKGELSRGVVLSPVWAAQGSVSGVASAGIGQEAESTLPWVSPAPVRNTFDGMWSEVAARVTPGNSGSLAVDPAGRYEFLGVPVLYNHYFHSSTLAGPDAFVALNRAIIRGSHGNVTRSQWRMRSGMLYLRLANGMEDADFNGRPTGLGIDGAPGGTTAPPGGTTAPPGGTTAPPGGTTAPPGTPCVGPTGSLLGSSGQAAQAVVAELTPADPRDLYKKLGISPFMNQNGERIYGYSMYSQYGRTGIYLYPNVESYRWIESHGNDPRYAGTQALRTPPDFLKMFQDKHILQLESRMSAEAAESYTRSGGQKVGVLVNYPGSSPRPASLQGVVNAGYNSFAPGDANQERRDVVTVDWDRRAVKISWKFLRRNGTSLASGVSRPGGCLRSDTDFSVYDELNLSVDSNGRIAGNSGFEPIVRVQSRRGDFYYIDLRPLFFTDLSIVFPTTARRSWAPQTTQDDKIADFAGQSGLLLREANPSGDGYASERFVEFHVTDQKTGMSGNATSYGCDYQH